MPKEEATRKRHRYVLQACHNCKAAKARCSGELPCEHCRMRKLVNCQYDDFGGVPYERYPPSHLTLNVATLLEQQSIKLDRILRSLLKVGVTPQSRGQVRLKANAGLGATDRGLPLIQGCTHSLFCVNIIAAKPELTRRASNRQSEADSGSKCFIIVQDNIVEAPLDDVSSPEVDFAGNVSAQSQELPYLVSDAETGRLMERYEDIVGVFYPFLPIEQLTRRMEGSVNARVSDRNELPDGSGTHELESATLSTILAIAAQSEEQGDQNTPATLDPSIRHLVSVLLLGSRIDLAVLAFLTLVSLYDYYGGRWRVAWRLITNVNRMVMECGLDRRLALDRAFKNLGQRTQAINTIWTIQILELNLSYALGLYTAATLHIEASFPRPVEAPYLTRMIAYAQIGKLACDVLLSDGEEVRHSYDERQDAYRYFEYRIEQWEKQVDEDFVPPTQREARTSGIWLLHVVLKIRANHIRGVVARGLLCPAASRSISPDIWERTVSTAANTVELLSDLSKVDLYRPLEAQCNHFLISAMGTLLLAVTEKHLCKSDLARIVAESRVTEPVAYKAWSNLNAGMHILASQGEYSPRAKHYWSIFRSLLARLKLDDSHSDPGTLGTGVNQASDVEVFEPGYIEGSQAYPTESNTYCGEGSFHWSASDIPTMDFLQASETFWDNLVPNVAL